MRLLFIYLVSFYTSISISAQWFDITPHGFPTSFAFTDASYLNVDTIFISCTDGIFIRTYDGGQTYTPDSSIRKGWYNSCPDTPGSHLESIHFINDSFGVAAGQDGVFYRTLDGGVDWQCKYLPGSPWVDVSDIFFWNSSKGVALCEYCTSLYYTDNGDLNTYSWTYKSVQHPQEIASTYDASYLASEDGVYQSADSGFTWQQISVGSDTRFLGIDARGEKIIAIGDNGAILQSENSGQTWRYVLDQKLTGYHFKEVAFVDDDNLLLISQEGPFENAYLIYTDFSISNILRVDTLSETGKIKDITFVDDSTGYIIAWDKILKTTNKAGVTGITFENSGQQAFIRPNPASGHIQVSTGKGFVTGTISIIDLTGKTVIAQEYRSHNQVIDISYLENGMYILRIEDEGEIYSAKLLKSH